MADATTVYRAHPTQAEIDEVLGQRRSAALGTFNEDDSIHLTYVIFLYQDGRLYLETASVTRKARNVAARPQASMLIQGPASTGRSLMVAAEGSARVIEGAKAQAINHRLRAKYIRPGALDAIDRAWGRFDDVAIEIEPLRWRSWTGDVLHAETQKELDGSYDDAWLPD
jgi:nitroimidazol reductase NimA-like FMN-containing flavoprotein (pyridoxamine 5'-phosphate oxidase superfamily)